MNKETIATKLEAAFDKYGFAEPNVAQLKKECDVSLRTLYKYYPSKEAMIIGALEYRHRRYIRYLKENLPENDAEAINYIIEKLHFWMQEHASKGCMSLHAMAAFPNNPLIYQAVSEHKNEIYKFLVNQSKTRELASALYLIHEGISSAWPVIGNESIETAKRVVTTLLEVEP